MATDYREATKCLLPLFATLLLGFIFYPPVIAGDRLPEPGAEEQASSVAAVKDAFRGRYERTGPADRRQLARELLKEAEIQSNTAATVYALLKQAGEVAADVGDAEAAVDAADRLGALFDVDAVRIKGEWLFTASTVGKRDAEKSTQVASALLSAR